jgi:hypothetical protein
VQRSDALQDLRAVGRRVSLAILRFRPFVAGKILPRGLIVFAASRHSTSVAGDDNPLPFPVITGYLTSASVVVFLLAGLGAASVGPSL